MQYRLITIEGNIGAGKTTLSQILAKRLNARLILESFADNPFLPKFYEDQKRYGFQLELFFMAERFKQLQDVILKPDLFQPTTVSDYIFIKSLLFAKVTLEQEEFNLYQRLFSIINQQLPTPDILIYLDVPIERLQRNIQQRNRSYEQSIPDNYLTQIQETYHTYIQQNKIKTLVINASNADFHHREDQIDFILNALEKDYAPGRHFLTLP